MPISRTILTLISLAVTPVFSASIHMDSRIDSLLLAVNMTLMDSRFVLIWNLV